MMKYEITGHIETFLSFEDMDQLVLSVEYTGKFVLPSKITSGTSHPYMLSLEADNDVQAKERAKHVLDNALSWLSVCFNVPVTGCSIEHLTQEGNSNSVYSKAIDISAVIVKRVTTTSNEMMSFGPTYMQILSMDTTQKDRMQSVHSFYRDALANSDPIRCFWLLYSVMLLLCFGGSGSDRMRVERRILGVGSSLGLSFPLLRNDHDHQEWSVFTAIRDSFSHAGSSFSGHPLDIRLQLKDHSHTFTQIVRQVILDEIR